MINTNNIEWVELYSSEAKKIDGYNSIKEAIEVGVKYKEIKADNDGKLYLTELTKSPGSFIISKINGKDVYLKCKAFAPN